MEQYADLVRGVEGPEQDTSTGEQRYVLRGADRDIRFSVMRDETDVNGGWRVSIEGVPPPGIVRPEPWPTPDEARDAAVKACEAILVLERMQREEAERYQPKA